MGTIGVVRFSLFNNSDIYHNLLTSFCMGVINFIFCKTDGIIVNFEISIPLIIILYQNNNRLATQSAKEAIFYIKSKKLKSINIEN